MQERYDAILAFCEKQAPVTIRGIYYHLTTLGLVPKTDPGYQKVARACKTMRLNGDLPWKYIADNTRWARAPRSFGSLEAALEDTARLYRRNLLDFAGADIEVWLEKDALAGVLYETTARWDVPLMVSRGYSSLTFLQSAATSLSKNAHVYVFSDYDASGVGIFSKIREGLQSFAPEKNISVERVMLDAHHVSEYRLPTRDPKGNDRKAGFAFCCELDAVPPNVLRAEAERCILQHVSEEQLTVLRSIETQERDSIQRIFSYMRADA